jgi:hypothetical protein
VIFTTMVMMVSSMACCLTSGTLALLRRSACGASAPVRP